MPNGSDVFCVGWNLLLLSEIQKEKESEQVTWKREDGSERVRRWAAQPQEPEAKNGVMIY